MNENPELASSWKGRILMQVECQATKKPVAKVAAIPEEVIEQWNHKKNTREYAIIAEVGQAVALPKAKKYSIKFIVGGKTLETSEAKV